MYVCMYVCLCTVNHITKTLHQNAIMKQEINDQHQTQQHYLFNLKTNLPKITHSEKKKSLHVIIIIIIYIKTRNVNAKAKAKDMRIFQL